MARFTSYETCTLCGKHTSKGAMTRHLASCPADHEAASGGKPSRLFRLRVEDAYSPFFWLDLEVKAGAKLYDLDGFLRGIWLECCGHLSALDIDGVNYSVSPSGAMFGGLPEERSMNVKLGDVLSAGMVCHHTYDFGTSTELKLRVVDEREGRIGKEPLRILSRNDPPVWGCEICGEPATQICGMCMYESDNPFYCEDHAEDHDCEEEEMLLSVVNSPRMGMCGYTEPA